jgi:D-alanine-D-alanine ligase
MVERYIKGRELEIAVLQQSPNLPLLISPPCEPIYKAEFYNYEAKYNRKGAHLSIPAKLPKHTADVLRSLSERIFTVLGCRHLARIDFFVGENGEVLFNEINTLPGMTESSVFPAAMSYLGHPIENWLPTLVEAARQSIR